ncbi:MAG: hypothetical protein ISR84_00180 [Kiritimatiellales bacterium]|nr:hypothetical protein [Kiritimatiellota bacterium]MBL7015952.1 hypothetical protein [Kiritimatiellales bacterium]
MDIKFNKLVGTKKTDFDLLVSEKVILLRSARLIPLINPGKEEALTSIFLSSLILIDEFKKDIFSNLGLPAGGQLYVYTEIVFPNTDNLRLDGLILIVSGGVIKSAAILEVKNGNSTLNKDQISSYLKIAKSLQIPKLITISNEFVSEPTQSPLKKIFVPKNIDLYHLSWQFIRTLARIRLFDNDTNIADEDQVRIMNEVVLYLENEKSGVGKLGFSQMKPGWKAIAEKVTSQATITKSDRELTETIESWIQEERDIALKLSCSLGTLVRTDARKFKGDMQARIDNDTEIFLKNKTLSSTLSIQSAVSDIEINANFTHKTVEMSVALLPPQDKTPRGQLGWIKTQVENKQLKKRLAEHPETPSILRELFVELSFKNARTKYRFPYCELEEQAQAIKGREIKSVSIINVKSFGKHFAAPVKFVELIEVMLPRFYTDIAQYLRNWIPPAPQMPAPSTEDSAPVIEDPE